MGSIVESMPRERDEESGRYTESYPPERFLKALAALDGMASTQEVATEAECEYRTTYEKLVGLEDSGEITSRKVGNARLWSIAED
jgi:hypothetical protein